MVRVVILDGFLIEPELIWFIALILFVISEAISMRLIAIWFGLGALSGLLTALFSDSVPVQLAVAVIVSSLFFLAAGPRKKHSRTHKNSLPAAGCRALVIESIDNAAKAGSVRISGNIFDARSEEGAAIGTGEAAVVTRVEDKIVFVKTAEK